MQEYWVVFTQGKTYAFTRWLKPNFSHIILVTRDRYNWIILNPTRLYLQVFIPANDINENPFENIINLNDSILKITFKARDSAKHYGSVGFLNCVTLTKYILGLRLWCITPWQLFNRLLAFKTSDMIKHGVISIERIQ